MRVALVAAAIVLACVPVPAAFAEGAELAAAPSVSGLHDAQMLLSVPQNGVVRVAVSVVQGAASGLQVAIEPPGRPAACSAQQDLAAGSTGADLVVQSGASVTVSCPLRAGSYVVRVSAEAGMAWIEATASGGTIVHA